MIYGHMIKLSLNQANISRIFLIFFLCLNVLFWFYAKDFQARWTNVSPAPDHKKAALGFLGDAQLAYRANSIKLQNMGDTGGRSTVFSDYNYNALLKWFYLMDYLDPQSDFIPILAGYYFGNVKDKEKLLKVIEYLRYAGNRKTGRKWRWLAQAIVLARFDLEDLDLALEMAKELAEINVSNMPGWTKQMPVFIMAKQGRKQAAYTLMIKILANQADEMHPNEVNFMRAYICEELLNEQEIDSNPICADYN